MRAITTLALASLFITAGAQSPQLEWIDIFPCADPDGTSGSQVARVVAMRNGDVLQTSWLRGTWDFDPGPGDFEMTSLPYPYTRLAVSRYGHDGELLWAWSLGPDLGYSIVTHAAELDNGDLMIIGAFKDSLDMDPGPGTAMVHSVPGWQNLWLARFTAGGDLVWARAYTTAGGAFPYQIEVNASGALWICGIFNTALDFGNGVSLSPGAATDGFMAKLDSAGNALWAHALGGPNNDNYIDLALAPTGDRVYLAGKFTGSMDLDPGPDSTIVTETLSDGFISCLDTSGAFLWGYALGGANGQVDIISLESADDGVFIDGVFTGNAQIDPADTSVHASPLLWWAGSFVARYDHDGHLVWFDNIGVLGGNSGGAMARTANGDIVVTWIPGQYVDLDPDTSEVAVGELPGGEGIVVAYDGDDGAYLWHHEVSGPGSQDAVSVATLGDQAVWLGGAYMSDSTYADSVMFPPSLCGSGYLLKYLRCTPPTIDANGITLIASAGDSFQWNLNGYPITGAEDQVLQAPMDGEYTVTVQNVTGCTMTSPPFTLLTTGIANSDGPAWWTNGTSLLLSRASGPAQVEVLTNDGRLVRSAQLNQGQVLDLSGLSPAVYLITATDHRGRTVIRAPWVTEMPR
ncbi:MAG: T9SS type A sorting domain-containing protein [Flavobacteriales bacterium]|nr:T9SS type A sorting domain-containing protein [Flavobacteriales bacterium]MBP6697403.1 T9SS type A sorting domain-containing protein [Flavobacteriales bacterium]